MPLDAVDENFGFVFVCVDHGLDPFELFIVHVLLGSHSALENSDSPFEFLVDIDDPAILGIDHFGDIFEEMSESGRVDAHFEVGMGRNGWNAVICGLIHELRLL